MNLLVVIHFPVYGGPHNRFLRLAGPLAERGWHTTVVVPDEPGTAADRLRSGGVDAITMPLGRLRNTKDLRLHARYMAHMPADVRRLQRVIRERQIDLVVIGGLVNPQAALAARLEKEPVVWQVLDTRSPMAVRRALMPLVRGLADVLMTTGREVANVHPGALAFGDRWFPFYSPVETRTFNPGRADRKAVRDEWGVAESDVVIGSTSNISPQKGIEYLIDTLAGVRAAGYDARLVLVGPEYDTHRAYSDSLRLRMRVHGLVEGDDVTFVGSRSDVERQLQGFDVFAMASVPASEGVPTSILEAMASGLPVISTDVGGVCEVVDEGVTGFVVPALDVRALVAQTARLLDDAAMRVAFAAEARRQAVARFDAAVCTETHLRAFEVALARRRRAAPVPTVGGRKAA